MGLMDQKDPMEVVDLTVKKDSKDDQVNRVKKDEEDEEDHQDHQLQEQGKEKVVL